MSVATIGAVGLTDTDLIIPGVPQIPYALLLTGAGSTTEVIEVRSLQRGGHVYVTRGAFGSLPVAHTAPVVVTLYDPNSGGGGGGGGVTVTGPGGTSIAATSLRVAAASDAGGGLAISAGWGLMLIATVDPDAEQTVPANDAFTTINLPIRSYNPFAYWSTNLPNSGTPGVLIPASFGGIHRVRLVTMTRTGSSNSVASFHAAIGFMSYSDSGDTFAWTPDEATTVLGGLDITLIAEFVGQMDAAEEAYFYAQQDDPGAGATAAPLRWPTYVTVERLTPAS